MIAQKTDEVIKLGARVAVSFDVNKEEFLEDQNKAIHKALYEGKAIFTNGDNYCPEFWNGEDDCLGEQSEDYEFSMPAFGTKLPYHVYAYVENRVAEIETIMRESRIRQPALEVALAELKKVQSLFI